MNLRVLFHKSEDGLQALVPSTGPVISGFVDTVDDTVGVRIDETQCFVNTTQDVLLIETGFCNQWR